MQTPQHLSNWLALISHPYDSIRHETRFKQRLHFVDDYVYRKGNVPECQLHPFSARKQLSLLIISIVHGLGIPCDRQVEVTCAQVTSKKMAGFSRRVGLMSLWPVSSGQLLSINTCARNVFGSHNLSEFNSSSFKLTENETHHTSISA